MGRGDLCEVAAGGVEDALRLCGRAGGVEDEERVLGVHRLRRADGVGGFDGLAPFDFRLGIQLTAGAAAVDHDQLFQFGQLVDEVAGQTFSIGIGLPRSGLSAVIRTFAPETSMRPDRARREPPKTTLWTAPMRVHAHRHGRLGHHRHVERPRGRPCRRRET